MRIDTDPLDNLESSRPALTLETIERDLPSRPFDTRMLPYTDHFCVICLEEYLLTSLLEGVPVRQMRCLHVYHSTCLSHWLQTQPSCPQCKQPTHGMGPELPIVPSV